MIIPIIFFKLLLCQTNNQPYFFILKVLEDGGGSIWLKLQYLKPFKLCANDSYKVELLVLDSNTWYPINYANK